MNQLTSTDSTLEISEFGTEAYRICHEINGNCHGVKFRVVTKTTTISFQGDVSEYQ